MLTTLLPIYGICLSRVVQHLPLVGDHHCTGSAPHLDQVLMLPLAFLKSQICDVGLVTVMTRIGNIHVKLLSFYGVVHIFDLGKVLVLSSVLFCMPVNTCLQPISHPRCSIGISVWHFYYCSWLFISGIVDLETLITYVSFARYF